MEEQEVWVWKDLYELNGLFATDLSTEQELGVPTALKPEDQNTLPMAPSSGDNSNRYKEVSVSRLQHGIVRA